MYRHSDAQELQYSIGYRDFCPSIALRGSSLTSAGGTVLIQVISNSLFGTSLIPTTMVPIKAILMKTSLYSGEYFGRRTAGFSRTHLRCCVKCEVTHPVRINRHSGGVLLA